MPTKTAPRRRHRIEMEELDGLRKRTFPGNPKAHDADFLKESVDEHAFVMPILVDDKTTCSAQGTAASRS
jgi:hypothetical protein